MTRSADRQQLMILVQEAVDSEASLTKACQRVGLSQRTLQRWRTVSDDLRATSPRPVQKNKLSAEEQAAVDVECDGTEPTLVLGYHLAEVGHNGALVLPVSARGCLQPQNRGL